MSHICSLICFPSMLIMRAPNSTPMVRSCTGWKRLYVNCSSRQDFPTPARGHSGQRALGRNQATQARTQVLAHRRTRVAYDNVFEQVPAQPPSTTRQPVRMLGRLCKEHGLQPGAHAKDIFLVYRGLFKLPSRGTGDTRSCCADAEAWCADASAHRRCSHQAVPSETVCWTVMR